MSADAQALILAEAERWGRRAASYEEIGDVSSESSEYVRGREAGLLSALRRIAGREPMSAPKGPMEAQAIISAEVERWRRRAAYYEAIGDISSEYGRGREAGLLSALRLIAGGSP